MAINVNQLTEQLRMMPDQALQRMAMMYKNDPYIFPMVISEDMARKKMRQAAQAQTAQPQPKVVDQALMSMGEQPQPMMPQASPGIAALQAPNMENMADGGIAGSSDMDYINHSEPVVRMSGGGMAHFRDGGSKGSDAKTKFIEQYRDLAERVGSETGIDPALILSQWGLESAWGTKTVGSFNFGNIKDVTGKGPKAEDKAEGSTDAYKTYKSPEDFAADYTNLLKRNFPKALGTGSDVSKFTEGLTKGRVGAYATDPGYAMKVGRVYGDLKETLPDRVPSDAGTTAAPVAAGIAATGVAGLMGGMGIKELFGTTFKPGTTARQAAGRILTGASVVPAAVLDGGAAASKKAADILAAASPEQRAQFYQNPMIGAMSPDDAFAAAIMNAAQGQPIKPPAKSMPYGEQMANVGKFVVTQPGKAIAAIPGAVVDTIAGKEKEYGPSLGYDWAESVPMDTKKDIIKDAKQTADPETKKQAKKEGWTNDDWLALGFGLLANKSPYLSEALGTAGLGVLAARREREKAAREEAKELSEATYRERLGREAEARGAYYTEGTKGATAAEQAALRAISEWQKAQPLAAQQMPDFAAKRETQYRAYLKEAYERLGLKMPEGLTSGTAATGQRVIDFSSIR